MNSLRSEIKLSIVVPMYNAGPYINDCISSILNQGIDSESYEVIVVNDGSKDQSLQLAKNLAATNEVIRVVDQPNQGNGAARNTGLDLAKGKYVYFLDSDDYLAPNTLGKILFLAEENALDIIGFGSKTVLSSSPNLSKTPEIGIGAVVDGNTFLAQTDYKAEVWWYLIKRSFLLSTGLRFYDRKFVQDAYYTPSVFSRAKRVAYAEACIHFYRINDTSITKTKSGDHYRKHLGDMRFAIEQLNALIAELQEQFPKTAERIYLKKQRYAFLILSRVAKSDHEKDEIKETMSFLKKNHAYPIARFVYPKNKAPVFESLRLLMNTPFLYFASTKLLRTIGL